jgi:hypothetical protein
VLRMRRARGIQSVARPGSGGRAPSGLKVSGPSVPGAARRKTESQARSTPGCAHDQMGEIEVTRGPRSGPRADVAPDVARARPRTPAQGHPEARATRARRPAVAPFVTITASHTAAVNAHTRHVQPQGRRRQAQRRKRGEREREPTAAPNGGALRRRVEPGGAA